MLSLREEKKDGLEEKIIIIIKHKIKAKKEQKNITDMLQMWGKTLST